MISEVGRYRITGELGRGAMGVVYLADDPLLHRQVAIKTIDLTVEDASQRQFLRERLLRDATAAAALSHPNIVSVYDVVEQQDAAYLVMEYIAGESLSSRLAAGPLPEFAFTLRVLREMAAALDYTHARGVIHRDIKPANVMIDARGTAKIMDFGIARITDTRTNSPTGMVMGTLQYMAPEQIKGERVDGRADQFSLAAMAYEMLCGSTIFGPQSFATLAYKIVNEMPAPARVHNGAVPEAVDEALFRALRKDPVERYATCTEFAAALERSFAVDPIRVTRTIGIEPPTARSAPAAGGRKTARLAMGVAAAVVVVAGAGLMIRKPWATAAPAPAVKPIASSTPVVKQEQDVVSTPTAKVKPTPVRHAAVAAEVAPKTVRRAETEAERHEDAEADPQEAAVPKPALEAFEEAETLANQGRMAEAIARYNRALSLRPGFFRALMGRAQAYQKQGQSAEAIADYTEVIHRWPRHSIALTHRGSCHLLRNETDEALADFTRALEIRKTPLALNGRGQVFLRRREYDKAMRDFTAAIAENPKLAVAYQNRARAERMTGDLRAAALDEKMARGLRGGSDIDRR